MKSIFFHLMPYRDLPDDFEERYESVWVTPPNAELCDPVKVAQYYKWNLDELELADELGFDGLGVNEHHQNAYGFMASPNLMAAALARRTPNNSAILVLGNTLALYSPALRVAEEFAMLDCMTDGRLAAGFPVGTSMDVNRCYGVTPTETRPRFYEAHDLIMKAWTQPGPFAYNGRFNKLRYVNPWPQPLQKPHPPVWLAGGGSVETYEMAVNNDYTYNFLSFFGYRFAKKVMDTFWETADRLGADRNPYRAGFAQQICVAETDEQAEELYAEHVMYFFKKCLHVPPYFMETPGYRTKRSAEFIMKTNSPAEMAAAATARDDWKSLVEQGFVIAGSAETVTERLREACRGLQRRQPHRPPADRLDAPRADEAEHHAASPRRSCRTSAGCGPTRGGSTGGGRRAPARARPSARRWVGSDVAQPEESFIELRDGRFKIRVLQAGIRRPAAVRPRRRRPVLGPAARRPRGEPPRHRARAPGRRRLAGPRARRGPVGPRPLLQRRCSTRSASSGRRSSATRSAAWSPPRSPRRARTASTSSC